ncbi:MAG: hypothetical protein LJE67_08565 [Salaquimonas sp.]|jgi:hypothetical protein|nr:hypothetical protein [Salaquimonas sp.]
MFARLFVFALLVVVSVSPAMAKWITNNDGCMFWGKETSPSKLDTHWSGGCTGGKANGEGILMYRHREGSQMVTFKFTGTLLDGMLAEGTIWRHDGGLVSGTFEDNKLSDGFIKTPTGDFFKGSFVDGKLNGPGMLSSAKGLLYEGVFANGSIEGAGTMWFPNGLVFVGTFRNNAPNGVGDCVLESRKGRCRVSQRMEPVWEE